MCVRIFFILRFQMNAQNGLQQNIKTITRIKKLTAARISKAQIKKIEKIKWISPSN